MRSSVVENFRIKYPEWSREGALEDQKEALKRSAAVSSLSKDTLMIFSQLSFTLTNIILTL
jgi:hypothetical protein